MPRPRVAVLVLAIVALVIVSAGDRFGPRRADPATVEREQDRVDRILGVRAVERVELVHEAQRRIAEREDAMAVKAWALRRSEEISAETQRAIRGE